MPLVKIVIQKNVAGPSVLGSEPAFVGDQLSVHEETASELISSGFAESEEALAAKAAEVDAAAAVEVAPQAEESMTQAAQERARR